MYQRTAPWIVPRTERTYHRAENWAFKNVPGVQKLMRATVYGLNEVTAFGLTYSPRHRRSSWCRGNIAKSIKDPELREKVTPEVRGRLQTHPAVQQLVPGDRPAECRPGHRRHQQDHRQRRGDQGRHRA